MNDRLAKRLEDIRTAPRYAGPPTIAVPPTSADRESYCMGNPLRDELRSGELMDNPYPQHPGSGQITHPGQSFGPAPECKQDGKPTNPKDAVGVRKAPMSTVPANVLAEIGVAMLEGASKYGRHNYRDAGVRSSVYYDGTMRHLMDWWEGQDIDPDSGLNHITKAIASMIVLRDAMLNDMVEDDRPPRPNLYRDRLNTLAAQIIDRFKDRRPKHHTEKGKRDAIAARFTR